MVKRKLLLYSLVFVLGYFASVMVLRSQTSNRPTNFSHTVETSTRVLPTSLTCIIGRDSSCGTVIPSDPYVCMAQFVGSGQTIIVQDGAGTPWQWLDAALGSMSTTTTWSWGSPDNSGCVRFSGGLYWEQTGGSAATGQLVIKYQ